jgi:WD40 repeat protein
MMRRLLFASWLVFSLCPHLLLAQGTRLWLQSHYDEFEKGQPQNVAITSDGYVEAGPELHQVLLTPSTYIWAVASDSHGNAYVATGSPATLLKISPDGTSTKLFSTRDLSVQTVKVGPDGSVYAATLPTGKVYRIQPSQTNLDESSATVVFDSAALSSGSPASGTPASPVKHDDNVKYIWDLAFDGQGQLYVATGGPAAIYRVNVATAKAKPELFFSSDEQHIRCLLFEPDGNLIAGTDGTGLVYRIGKDGKGIVLYDAPKREVTALAESAGGQLYVAAVGEKTKSALPPLPVQGIAIPTATITIVTPGSVQASSSNTLIPEGSEIDELSAQGAPRKLWASRDDVVYALRSTPQGLLAATGNRGRIYRILEDGSYVDLARTASGQAMSFAKAPGGTYVGTSNTGRLYKLNDQPAADGTYLSDVFDSGVFSTWGRAEVNANDGGPSGPFDLFARTGNIENPERNWSPWQKVAPGNSSIGTPAARFVQWKVVLHPGGRVSSVGINYLPVNIAPVVDEIVVEPGARVNQSSVQPAQPQQITINLPSAQNGVAFTQDASSQPLAAFKDPNAVTVRWGAHDDNGDDLLFDVYYRGDGEKNWRLLRARLKDRFYSFDSIRLPDGGYRCKIVASDAPSHPAGDALTGDRESEHFVIDTTPPAIAPLTARIEGGKVHATFEATDATSPVTRAEYSLDAGPWQYLEPVGKLSDSLTEHYDFSVDLRPPQDEEPGVRPQGPSDPAIADPGEHVLAVRVYDRYDNVNAAKVVVH